MPILDSPKKELRARKAKTARNEKKKTRLERLTKKTLKLIQMGEKQLAQQQLPAVYKELDKAAKTNTISRNKAARTKSRLAKKVNNIDSNVKTARKNS